MVFSCILCELSFATLQDLVLHDQAVDHKQLQVLKIIRSMCLVSNRLAMLLVNIAQLQQTQSLNGLLILVEVNIMPQRLNYLLPPNKLIPEFPIQTALRILLMQIQMNKLEKDKESALPLLLHPLL